jgi:hypothetical protein
MMAGAGSKQPRLAARPFLHFLICHSKSAIDPTPQDVTRDQDNEVENIRDANVEMHNM